MISLQRLPSTPQGTFGVLSKDGIPLCVTVERPWADNANGVSCIPEGTYRFVSYNSPTKGGVWLGQNVPGRSEIEIHSANLASELEGCIAVGQWFADFNGVRGVANSKPTLEMLKIALPAEFDLVITQRTQLSQ